MIDHGDTLIADPENEPRIDNDRDEDSDLIRRRREFESYVHVKVREIDEQRWAWRYYHVDQWTPHQLRTLRKRGQPMITFDRTGRKIDSLGGTIRRLRTDPKCYPNTPNGEQGAEVATQVIRTICDASMAEDIEVECVRDALIHGIGVDELVLIPVPGSTIRAVSAIISRMHAITAFTSGPISTNWTSWCRAPRNRSPTVTITGSGPGSMSTAR
jgi:hypothetical protein